MAENYSHLRSYAMRLITSSVLVLSLALALAHGLSAQGPQFTNLFTPEERAAAGLAKLSPAELGALNAALTRVYVALLTPATSTRPGPATGRDDKLDLYDSRGRPVAFLDAPDELTFYLWSGEPVAYLDEESVYGFNGKHLGWYVSGRVYDPDGKLVAIPASDFTSP